MVQERIEIVVTDRGTRRVKRDIASIGQASNVAAQSVTFLRKALLGLSAFVIVRGLSRTVDAFTKIQNALRLVTDGTENLNNVTDELLQISNETRSSLEKNADFFRRLTLATRELSVSEEELLRVTRSINQAIQISGATTKEAENGLIQLAQGLSSGGLRGDELRSVLEQLPAVADVIANRLGVTRGELRSLGAQFRITSGVIVEAFGEAADELDARFSKVVPTISQSLTVLSNNFTVVFGRLSEGLGLTNLVSQAFLTLALSLDTLVKSLTTAGGAFLGLKIGGYVQSLRLARAANAELTAQVAAGNLVILGSAEAERQQAVAAFESASATFAAADAEVVRARAATSTAVVLRQKSAAGLNEVEVLNAVALAEGRLSVLSTELAASEQRLIAAETALTAQRSANLGVANASAEAELRLAQAQLANTQATITNTESTLASLAADLRKAQAVTASTQAQFAAGASTQTLTALEAEAAVAETALTAAIARRDAATVKASASQGIYAVATRAAASAVRSLTVALFANPVTAFITLIFAAGAALFAFRREITFGSKGVADLGDFAKASFQQIQLSVRAALDVLGEFVTSVLGIPNPFKDHELRFQDFLRFFAVSLDVFIGLFIGVKNVVINEVKNIGVFLQSFGVSFRFFFENLGKAAKASLEGNFADAALFAETAVENFRSGNLNSFNALGANAAKSFSDGFNSSTVFENAFDDTIKRAEENRLAELKAAGQGPGSDRTGAVDAIIEQLSQELGLLTMSNQERAVEQQFLEITRKLLQEGVVIEEGSVAAIKLRTALEKNAAAERTIAFRQQAGFLQQESVLLQQSTRERSLQNTLLQLRNQIAGEGGELTTDQESMLLALAQTNLELAEEAALLQEINGPLEEYQTKLETLGRLLQKNKGFQDQYNASVRDLRIQALETSTSLEGGLERGLLKTQARLEDLASTGEQAVVQSFQAVEDSLVTLARTGELSFQGLVDSILDGLAKIAAQQLVQGLLSSVSGLFGVGGGAGAALGAGKASGGSVASGSVFPVNENGAELFAPPGAGKIIPAGKTREMVSSAAQPAPAPEVNVSVVNVTSEDEALSAIGSSKGEQLILNVIRRNRSTIKGELG